MSNIITLIYLLNIEVEKNMKNARGLKEVKSNGMKLGLVMI